MTHPPGQIETARLRLVAGTREMLRAELESTAALARALDADIPGSWPPELYDADAVRYMLDLCESRPSDFTWGLYYVLERTGGPVERFVAVGAGGYKGAPDEMGAVEIGYSIVPERRRRGYAREAVEGWLAHAFADPRVDRVIAHTLVDLTPSIGVLEVTGFAFDGAGTDPQEPTAVRYAISRHDYVERQRLAAGEVPRNS